MPGALAVLLMIICRLAAGPSHRHLVIQRAAAGLVLYLSAGMGGSACFILELMQ